MENFRSMSCREGRMRLESSDEEKRAPYPTTMEDLRSYSTSYAGQMGKKQAKVKKSKSIRVNSGGSFSSASSSSSWSLSDPELQRKKRVAGYKIYDVEGKMKGSFRKSFRWIKNTCSHVVFGWW
ncbi:hypothetical protein Nepgr_019435 [Nepenthes gracilis]|uniref:Uncharacterized protein n=1 Tax=Nepenthes gracilis TaxID=150966 RepID=A0AAD3XV08_NEPGR|nr:hypothetical protein Nepgr_019435 [Nepenthes gracilis]